MTRYITSEEAARRGMFSLMVNDFTLKERADYAEKEKDREKLKQAKETVYTFGRMFFNGEACRNHSSSPLVDALTDILEGVPVAAAGRLSFINRKVRHDTLRLETSLDLLLSSESCAFIFDIVLPDKEENDINALWAIAGAENLLPSSVREFMYIPYSPEGVLLREKTVELSRWAFLRQVYPVMRNFIQALQEPSVKVEGEKREELSSLKEKLQHAVLTDENAGELIQDILKAKELIAGFEPLLKARASETPIPLPAGGYYTEVQEGYHTISDTFSCVQFLMEKGSRQEEVWKRLSLSPKKAEQLFKQVGKEEEYQMFIEKKHRKAYKVLPSLP